MYKAYIDHLIENLLEGDKSRVLELFNSDGILNDLCKNSQTADWFHFEPKTYDGAYLVKLDGRYSCYMQERGRSYGLEKFDNLNDAARHFFKSEGYIE